MADRKKSLFPVATTVASGASLDYFVNGVNYQITYDNFIAGLGVTGSIVQDGDPAGVPVLDIQGSVNNIRNIEANSGISAVVSAQNGVELNHSFVNDGTGVALLTDISATNPIFRSLVGINGIGVGVNGNAIEIDGGATGFVNRIIVTQASDLSGTIDSTKEYFIDGVVDMGSQAIEIPTGGLTLNGFGFDISKLISSDPNYTLFTSPGGGSGNLILSNLAIEITGTNSQVFDINSATGFEAIEKRSVNYNNCVSLGEIDGYRQGFEDGCGRFGATPELTLSGAWSGGYFIDSSIVRSLDNAMSGSLFKAGTAFAMQSRFRANMNVDLGTTAAFFDFSDTNFPNPSTLQLTDCIVSRGAVVDAGDTTIIPNIDSSNLSCSWTNNQGTENTFEGGTQTVSVEVATVIGSSSTFVDLLGTFTASDLQHFDSPSNGQLRHVGNSPREYRMAGDFVIVGTTGDEIEIKAVKWDDSASGFVDIGSQRRQVNALVGGRDVAFFNSTATFTLDKNDYVKIQVANNSAARNVTAELDSFYTVYER
jgi:hypothetical protein